MVMTNTIKSLERKVQEAVEQVVREHLAQCQAAALVAVREAFESTARWSSSRGGGRSNSTPRRSPSPRRSQDELAELQKRLYEAICAHPGETMAVIGPAVGATATELRQPMIRLRRAERIRSIGQHHNTRYFPIGP